MKDFRVPTGKIIAIRTYASDSKRVADAWKSEKKQTLVSPATQKLSGTPTVQKPQQTTQKVVLDPIPDSTAHNTSVPPTPPSTAVKGKGDIPTALQSITVSETQTPPHTQKKESVVILGAEGHMKSTTDTYETKENVTTKQSQNIASEIASEIEAGSFITDRKRARPSLGKIMRSAFSEWWGTTRDSVETTVAAMPLPIAKVKPTIAPAVERKEVIKEAAQLTNQVPRDDHRVVVQKVKATTPLKKETSQRSFTVKRTPTDQNPVWGSSVKPVNTEKETRATIAKPAPTLRTQTLDLRAHISTHETATVAPKKFWEFNLHKPIPIPKDTLPVRTERTPQQVPPDIPAPTPVAENLPVITEIVTDTVPRESSSASFGPVPYQHINTAPVPIATSAPTLQSSVITTPKRAPLIRLRETPLPYTQTREAPIETPSRVDTLVVPPLREAAPEEAPHAIHDTSYTSIATSASRPDTSETIARKQAIIPIPHTEEQGTPAPENTRETAVPQEPTHHAKRSRKRILEILLYVLIVIFGASLGIGTAYLFYAKTRAPETPVDGNPTDTTPSVLLADAQHTLPLTTIHSELLATLTARKDTDTEQVTEYVFTETGEPTASLVDATTVMDILAPNAPSSFVRSVRNHIIFGSVFTDIREPFIILEAHNFDVAFAGMLAWERMMSTDLAPFFGTAIPESTSQFTDALSVNKSIRILYGKNGEDKLMYAFINGSYICITTSTKALSLIIERLR